MISVTLPKNYFMQYKLAICLSFLLFTSHFSAGAELLDYIVAVVNDEVITDSALQQELQMVETRLRDQKIRLPSRADLEKQVLEGMVMNALQLQLAKRTGIVIDDDSLNEALRNIATQDHVSLQVFRENLERQGINFAHFRENIRQQMTVARLQQRQIVNRITVTDREIDNFLTNQQQQGLVGIEYHLLHILIAIPEAASPEQIAAKQQKALDIFGKLRKGANFQETAVTVSDGKQALEGGDLGWRKLGEIPSLFVDAIKTLKIGEISEPIRNASGFHIIKFAGKRNSEKAIITQTKVRHILIKTSEIVADAEVQSRLEKLKARIEAGEDFAQLARSNSEDTQSAQAGGSLDWVSPSDIVPEFEDVLNSLGKNQISKPFKSRYGWHIVQVLDRRQYDDTDKALRTKATQQIRQRKIEEELQSWLRQMRDEAYVEVRPHRTEVSEKRIP